MEKDILEYKDGLKILKKEYERFSSIEKSLPKVLNIITKEFRKAFKGFKILTVRINKYGSLYIFTNKKFNKISQEDWMRHNSENWFLKTGFKGDAIYICSVNDGVTWSFKNTLKKHFIK